MTFTLYYSLDILYPQVVLDTEVISVLGTSVSSFPRFSYLLDWSDRSGGD